MEKIKVYVCGKCAKLHHLPWTGDCAEKHRTFDKAELDKAYGPDGWETVDEPKVAKSA